MVARAPDDETRTILASVKCNVGPKPTSVAYRVVAADNGMGRIDWLGTSPHTGTTLLAQRAEGEEGSRVAEACRVMRDVLAAGPVEAKEAKRRVGEEAGVAPRTVDNAKVRLGVVSRKEGFRGWMWMLPEATSQQASEHRKPFEAAIFEETLRSSRESSPGAGNHQPVFEEVI